MEYKENCDNCNKKGDQMFARIFFKKVSDKWIYLCATCWDKLK